MWSDDIHSIAALTPPRGHREYRFGFNPPLLFFDNQGRGVRPAMCTGAEGPALKAEVSSHMLILFCKGEGNPISV